MHSNCIKFSKPSCKHQLKKGLIFMCSLSLLIYVSNAQTIWNSGSFSFSFTAAGQNDCLTAQTCLTRSTVLYNSVCQIVSGTQGCTYSGPCNTMWAVGNIANWNTLSYKFLYAALPCPGPPNWVGIPFVCHLLAENIYLQITFNSWTSGTNGAFSYTRSTSATVPVLISNFTGQKSGHANLLHWTSKTENNCSHYNIQRSANGTDFTTQGRVESKSISGNSSIDLNYTYSDAQPLAGHNYYRLEQLDKDGQKDYSKVVDIFFNNMGSTIAIFQNTVNNLVRVNISASKSSSATVTIADMTGKVLKTKYANIATGNNDLLIRLDYPPKGIYLIQVYEDDRLSFRGKVIKAF